MLDPNQPISRSSLHALVEIAPRLRNAKGAATPALFLFDRAHGLILIHSLWTSRNLLFNLIRRDLTVRYKSTVLGFFWSFAKPLAYMGIYQLIFGTILQMGIDQKEIPYSLHVLAGVLPWTFFAGATGEAMYSIRANANLINKVKLPLEVFPVASICAQSVHFALAMLVLLVAVLVLPNLAPGPLFLLVPLIMALQVVLILAVSLFLSAVNVFYRDIVSIWEVVAAAWFYATPIIYPANRAVNYLDDNVGAWAVWAYLANPMAIITIAYRRLILYGALDLQDPTLELSDGQLIRALALALAVCFVLLALAHRLFFKLSRRFADEL